jgi:hypothetical protein
MKTIRTVPEGTMKEAYSFTKIYCLQDSLKSIEIVQKAADIRTNYEIAQKQIEVY